MLDPPIAQRRVSAGHDAPHVANGVVRQAGELTIVFVATTRAIAPVMATPAGRERQLGRSAPRPSARGVCLCTTLARATGLALSPVVRGVSQASGDPGARSPGLQTGVCLRRSGRCGVRQTPCRVVLTLPKGKSPRPGKDSPGALAANPHLPVAWLTCD